jgi:transcriptional regulator with XRE-family HTH domain
MELGEKIKTLRKRQGLSQEELAERVEINSTHLSRLETGKYQPSIDVLKRLAEALEVSADHLLSAEAEEPAEVHIRNKPLADRIRLIDSLEESDQQALIQVIDSMLTKHRMRELLGGAGGQTAP